MPNIHSFQLLKCQINIQINWIYLDFGAVALTKTTLVIIFWLRIDQKIINQEKNLRADPENNPEL